ncbi:NmrA family NAD(P)-binding protein [Escherichia coli]
MIAITGATGQLGHYVIESLMKTVPASQILAIVRNPAKAQALAAQGITVRQADYGDEAASSHFRSWKNDRPSLPAKWVTRRAASGRY